MNRLLKASAIIELPIGLGLIALPDLVVRLLLGVDISGGAIPLGRVTGVALLALGVACWFASHEAYGSAARGVVRAMITYNLGVLLVLGAAGLDAQQSGIGLWPAVALHAGMALWCVAQLLNGGRDSRSSL